MGGAVVWGVSVEELKARTFRIGVECLRLAESLRPSAAARSLGYQLLRSATSLGANYRAASRARSRADFIAKLKIVEEECDEALYWLEVLREANIVKPQSVAPLVKEGTELLRIVVASLRTARDHSA